MSLQKTGLEVLKMYFSHCAFWVIGQFGGYSPGYTTDCRLMHILEIKC